MKIAFLSTEDPKDKDVFSGSTFNIVESLQRAGAEVQCIGPIEARPSRTESYLRKQWPRFDKFRPWAFAPTRLRAIARVAEERLSKLPHDIVLSRSTWPMAYLKSKKPLALWHDATFKLLCEGYSGYADQRPRAKHWGEQVDRMAFTKTALGIFTSNWAADSAIQSGGLKPERARRVLLGANRPCRLTEAELQRKMAGRDFSTLKLLFIGTEWHRKGGSVFVELIKQLRNLHIPVEANMVGPWPPTYEEVPPYVRCYGRVSFKNPAGAALIEDLMLSSNYLVLPTRHDCTPVVIPDALSHGLPVLAQATGGIPEMIQPSYGLTANFMSADGIQSAAAYLRDILSQPDRWKTQALAARDEYLKRQNWDRHGADMARLLTVLYSGLPQSS